MIPIWQLRFVKDKENKKKKNVKAGLGFSPGTRAQQCPSEAITENFDY